MVSFSDQGTSHLFQEGTKISSGVYEIFLKNMEACEDIRRQISSSFGPNGMNKLLIRKNGKILITSDTVSILNNLKFIHPASKVLVFSALFQEQELGDNAGLVIILGTEILKQAYGLLKIGFRTSEIIQTFQEAGEITLKLLNSLTVNKIFDLKNLNLINLILSSCCKEGDKEFKNFIIPQISFICSKIMFGTGGKFLKENLRVIKILGGSSRQTKTISGTVILKDTEGSVKNVRKANIAIYSCSFDLPEIETKNSFLFEKPEEVLSYEGDLVHSLGEKIRKLHQKGINVIVANNFGDLALNFMEELKIMAIKVQSKFDMKRIALTSNSVILPRVVAPNEKEIGKCDLVSVRGFSSQKVTIFKQNLAENKIFTMIVRGNTIHFLDKIERMIFRATSVFKTIVRDQRLVSGAGACELEIYRRLKKIAQKRKGASQKFIFEKFAESFEIIPLLLLTNEGRNSLIDLSFLHSIHLSGGKYEGIRSKFFPSQKNSNQEIFDSYSCKFWSFKHAFDSAIILLSVDQVIMSREFNKNFQNTED